VHLGVGISGREGNQAVLSSDYSIAQFAFLPQLLLVHGRWSLQRISIMVMYSLYKNVGLTFTLILYGTQSGFSAPISVPELSGGSLWNLYYTALPIMLVSLLDRDMVYQETLLAIPEMYKDTQNTSLFSGMLLGRWIVESFFVSIFVYLFNTAAVCDWKRINQAGMPCFHESYIWWGLFIQQVIYTVRLFLVTKTWTVYNLFVCVLSLLLWPLTTLITSLVLAQNDFSFLFEVEGFEMWWAVMASWNGWAVLYLSLVIGLMPFLVMTLVAKMWGKATISNKVAAWEAVIIQNQARMGRVIPGDDWALLMPQMVHRDQDTIEQSPVTPMTSPKVPQYQLPS